MLFQIWSKESNRATRDLDFLSFGRNDIQTLTEIFRRICLIEIENDGITFDLTEIKSEKIKADQEYEGVRIQVPAFLERTKIPLRIDVGFGDVVTPEIREINFPTLLDFPEPEIKIYPPETVVAEKFQALVDLGMSNSRLKDFYDLYFLTLNFQFESEILTKAIGATFERRKTELPKYLPIALTDEFALDPGKQTQWKSFLRKSNTSENLELEEVIEHLGDFFGKLLDLRKRL